MAGRHAQVAFAPETRTLLLLRVSGLTRIEIPLSRAKRSRTGSFLVSVDDPSSLTFVDALAEDRAGLLIREIMKYEPIALGLDVMFPRKSIDARASRVRAAGETLLR